MSNSLPIKTILREEEEKRAIYYAKKYGLPYLDLRKIAPHPDSIGLINENNARKYGLIIISRVDNILNLITPFELNAASSKFLDTLKNKGWRIRLFFCSFSGFKRALEYYKFYTPPMPSLKNILIITQGEIENLKNEAHSIEELKNKIQTVSSEKLLKIVISSALTLEATDIHFDPKKNGVLLRLRIDTILQEIVEFKTSLYDPLVSRIKILSGLKINIRNTSQDGRFTIRIVDADDKILREVDVRVSVIPGGNAEIIILRLLGIGIKRLVLEELGLTKRYVDKLKFYAEKTNGLILTTGPTSSGKSTTLYAAIKYIQNPQINIVTIEDPIEYKMEGVNQSQVNEEEDYTFPKALRAILRQDPDVILVGEIRDNETAKTAVQAALTGHLVLSTTHTNDAPSTILRLKELGLDEKEITSSTQIIMAQRLVRKLCNYCKEKYIPSPDIIESIKMVLSLISPKAHIDIPQEINFLYKARGCKNCFGFGYKGLTGVFEVMEITESLEKMILDGESSIFKLRAEAMEEGMITLLQDAVLKMIWGITDLEEVKRVVGDFNYIESLYGHTVASILTKSLKIPSEIYNQTNALKTFKSIGLYLIKTPYEKILEAISSIALILRATDIHIEPQEKHILIRLRVDGVLEDLTRLPKEEFLPLLAEIRTISGINEDIVGKTIDGRFKIILFNDSYNVRVSIIPGGYGETFVLRILRPDIDKVSLENLGIPDSELNTINDLIKKTKGMILATGPTSSGKTTTLFALISKINHPGIKVITVEDPIEYTIEGLVQTQINETENYTFSEALRHILRQNPNVVLIGEIRDNETARVAVQASLTGHLLLSTVHTNDSFSAIERFKTLGVDATQIANSLNAIIAQRLVRKLCPYCKKPAEATPAEVQLIQQALKDLKNQGLVAKYDFKNLVLYKNVGCEQCGPTGYLGQIGVFEILSIDDELRKLIFEDRPAFEIKKIALKRGIMLMQHDAMLKILEGITTIDEYKRVFG